MEDFTATRPSTVIVLDLESEADILARVGGRVVDMATGTWVLERTIVDRWCCFCSGVVDAFDAASISICRDFCLRVENLSWKRSRMDLNCFRLELRQG